MSAATTEALIRTYYDRFNAKDVEGFLKLLTDDVVHDISQGGRETGKAAFRKFLQGMNVAYEETATDLVVMTEPSGTRAAAEFTIDGKYLKSDGAGMPAAKGQKYTLRVGAFFEIRDGRVARISNHYNFKDWVRQVEK
jgi:steroid delta-isomerase-like uncharacterized protein